jgi:hypothetical protein
MPDPGGSIMNRLLAWAIILAAAACAQSLQNIQPKGQRYEAVVPDTLDLADRAAKAINGLTGTLDPQRDYEIYFRVYLNAQPAYLFHDTTGLPTNNPKFAESLPMMRAVSGSGQALDTEAGFMRAMLSAIDKDGLFYAIAAPNRPWHEGVGHNYNKRFNLDFANVYGNSRLLLAMMAWYQRDKDPAWMDRMQHLAQALSRIAIRREGYAYYPDSEIGEAFSFAKGRGWLRTDEPLVEAMGAEGSMFMYHCGPIRALARWYAMTGDTQALLTATRLVNFVMQPRFWGGKIEVTGASSFDRGQWTGHQHAHTAILRALLDYAIVTNDSTLKRFVRNGYEYARASFGLPRIGMFNESCTIGDMVGLAIRLSDAGIGNYWEDVDQYARNHLVEAQLLDAELMKTTSTYGPPHEVNAPQESAQDVFQRSVGLYCSQASVTAIPGTMSIGCCTGNGTQGLYYAWDSIVQHANGLVKVNLLLNRASPWVDVNSYLPYEGKVELLNKSADRISVRLPLWVDRSKVRYQVGAKTVNPTLLDDYALFENLSRKDVVTIEFPVVETVEKYTIVDRFHPVPGREYTFQFRGNTVVDVSPRQGKESYPIYQRDAYKLANAPMKRVVRFVSEAPIEW